MATVSRINCERNSFMDRGIYLEMLASRCTDANFNIYIEGLQRYHAKYDTEVTAIIEKLLLKFESPIKHADSLEGLESILSKKNEIKGLIEMYNHRAERNQASLFHNIYMIYKIWGKHCYFPISCQEINDEHNYNTYETYDYFVAKMYTHPAYNPLADELKYIEMLITKSHDEKLINDKI